MSKSKGLTTAEKFVIDTKSAEGVPAKEIAAFLSLHTKTVSAYLRAKAKQKLTEQGVGTGEGLNDFGQRDGVTVMTQKASEKGDLFDQSQRDEQKDEDGRNAAFDKKYGKNMHRIDPNKPIR